MMTASLFSLWLTSKERYFVMGFSAVLTCIYISISMGIGKRERVYLPFQIDLYSNLFLFSGIESFGMGIL